MNTENKISLSFIIPTLNESSYIGETIDSIKYTLDNCLPAPIHEIIVVDNGSSDNTVEIAKSKGIKVFLAPEATIAGLRNIGTANSSYDYLVFIDADVTLDKNWYAEFQKIPQLACSDNFITGSRCLSQKATFLSKYWFDLMSQENKVNYINSGHLILNRSLFFQINGFNNNLRTGEDYDLCVRAVGKNAKLFENKKLKAYHHRYPKTIFEFLKREYWHGSQDFVSLASIRNSKPALLVIANLLALTLIGSLSLLTNSLIPILSYITLTILAIIIFTKVKFPSISSLEIIPSAIIMTIYLSARTAAIINKSQKRWKQAKI